MLSATISVTYLVLPLLSLYERVRMRPSMKSWVPFLTYFSATSAKFLYFSATSAKFLQHTILCHSVCSFSSPEVRSLNFSVVASENVAVTTPLSRCLTSGSLPAFPISRTLFNEKK